MCDFIVIMYDGEVTSKYYVKMCNALQGEVVAFHLVGPKMHAPKTWELDGNSSLTPGYALSE